MDATGHAIAQHAADYSPVTQQNPAQAGEYVVVYGINLGPVTNTPKTGYAALGIPLSTFDTSTLTWGTNVCNVSDIVGIQGIGVAPSYDGLAPGLVGVYQINFQIPTRIPAGELAITVQRTLASVPLGRCSPSQPGFSVTTVTSASALISIR
jgi:uncharacterized protein (TIGR03437 family)